MINEGQITLIPVSLIQVITNSSLSSSISRLVSEASLRGLVADLGTFFFLGALALVILLEAMVKMASC